MYTHFATHTHSIANTGQPMLHITSLCLPPGQGSSCSESARLLVHTYVPLSVAHLLGEAEEAAHGVGACGEDEDQRRGADHACIEDAQVNGRALHKQGAKVLYHKVGHCLGNLEGAGDIDGLNVQ